jgi:dTDP-4-dehydrorhamnose 3,5-epimerase-like enzyme
MGKNNKNKNKTKSKPLMCLNMIVKNEAHVITETLTNILKYIDYWVICDTGSTDGTQDIIKNFFSANKIEGELHQHEWKNFGYNRSKAFEAAHNKSSYVWVIDADDLIVGNLVLPKKMTKDIYLLNYGGTNLCYPRGQIFNNEYKWKYRGVLHEFAVCTENKKMDSERIEGNYYIDSRRLGDRNKDPKKYLKDAEVLIKAIENKEDSDLAGRYTFYVGQSYRDYGDVENSIKYYEKRTKMDGWLEEIYVSYMEIGLLLLKTNGKKEQIIETFLNGFKTLQTRAECLYFLSTYYLQINDVENAWKTCKLASKIKNPTNLLLFIKTDIHNYKCKELLFIIYNVIINKKIQIKNLTNEIINGEIKTLSDFLLTDTKVPESVKTNVKNILNSQTLIVPTMLNDYYFIENTDSMGNDIVYYENKTIEELDELANLFVDSIGFNTYGYLKDKINFPLIRLENKRFFNDGFYIKKSFADKLMKKINKKLTEFNEVKEKITLSHLDLLDIDNDQTINNPIDNMELVEISETKTNSNSNPNPYVILNNDSNQTVSSEKKTDDYEILVDPIDMPDSDIYNEKLVNKIYENTKNTKNTKKSVTLSITTCKRLNLFERTMNSFINCCTDILLIDEFICVDDNSSEEDRKKMQTLYPFFTWIFKGPEEKGHIASMNIIIDRVKTDYLLHMEDDWLFTKKLSYISNGLEILNQKEINQVDTIPANRNINSKIVGQVVFNKNYTELSENEVEGGFLCLSDKNKIKYLIHEHYDPQKENFLYINAISKYVRTSIYWPHYSLQPSLTKTEIFKTVGKFSDSNGFFERDFANRYYTSGYITTFFNGVYCRHIGKLLSQKNDPNIKNAYQLNQIDQFEVSKKTNSDNKIDELNDKLNKLKDKIKESDEKNIQNDLPDFPDYIFYPNKDSVSNDIIFVNSLDTNKLKLLSDEMPKCVAFNTLGYLKYDVTDEKDFIYLPNLKNKVDGLYVKKKK